MTSLQVANGEELAHPQEEARGAGSEARLEEVLGVFEGDDVAVLCVRRGHAGYRRQRAAPRPR